MTIQKPLSFCQLQGMAHRLEPENGEREGNIRAGIPHLLSVSMLTPRDDHQFLGHQNEVTNGYNKAYDFSHGDSAFSEIFTYLTGLFEDKEDLLIYIHTHSLITVLIKRREAYAWATGNICHC